MVTDRGGEELDVEKGAIIRVMTCNGDAQYGM
jgi:hypothetical protein